MYRVAIFIDGGYLDKILRRELNGLQIDLDEFTRAIAASVHPTADILRTYYYHCLPYKSTPPTQEETERFAAMESFLDALNRLPRFVVRLGRLARRGPDEDGRFSFEQKMIDVLLSLDLVQMSLKGKITHAAIVAGDSDFVPAIEVAKNESVAVWLFHGSQLHNSLWDVADERIELARLFG